MADLITSKFLKLGIIQELIEFRFDEPEPPISRGFKNQVNAIRCCMYSIVYVSILAGLAGFLL